MSYKNKIKQNVIHDNGPLTTTCLDSVISLFTKPQDLIARISNIYSWNYQVKYDGLYTVEATYKGRLYKGQFKKYGLFPISRVQIFALYKGQKLP